MANVRQTVEIDDDTGVRVRELARTRGQDMSTVLAEAVALLESVAGSIGPDVAEDRRRLDEFTQTGLAVPLDEVKSWVASWDAADEVARPQPRKVG